MRKIAYLASCCWLAALFATAAQATAQAGDPHAGTGTHAVRPPAVSDSFYLLRPDRVFDGEQMHEGWQVLVHGRLIEAAGPAGSIKTPAGAVVMDLKGATLLPGLIEGHSHLFLHPYNEVSWNDQVLKESRAERVARATVHARATLLAGFKIGRASCRERV